MHTRLHQNGQEPVHKVVPIPSGLAHCFSFPPGVGEATLLGEVKMAEVVELTRRISVPFPLPPPLLIPDAELDVGFTAL